jgi:hypothetical protein
MYDVAMDLLAIPSTSASVERVFSRLNLITDSRKKPDWIRIGAAKVFHELQQAILQRCQAVKIERYMHCPGSTSVFNGVVVVK